MFEEDLWAVLLSEARHGLCQGHDVPRRDHHDHLAKRDTTGRVVEDEPRRGNAVAEDDRLVFFESGVLLLGVPAPVVGHGRRFVGEEDGDDVLAGDVIG